MHKILTFIANLLFSLEEQEAIMQTIYEKGYNPHFITHRLAKFFEL